MAQDAVLYFRLTEVAHSPGVVRLKKAEQTLRRTMGPALEKIGRSAQRGARQQLSARPRGTPYPEGPLMPIAARSAALRRSIGYAVGEQPKGTFHLDFGIMRQRSRWSLASEGGTLGGAAMQAMDSTGSLIEIYAGTQEHGATIVPTHGTYLAFPPGDPGGPARDARGVQTQTATTIKETYRTWFYPKDAPRMILGVERGSPPGTPPELLFYVRTSVRIPARPFLAPRFEQMQAKIDGVVAGAMEAAF